MVFSIRTIFLFIRGINQTGMALGDVSKGLKSVEERQKSLAQAAYRLAFAGAAFMAFGAMMAGAMFKMLDASVRGQRVLGDFGRAIDRIKKSFAEATLNLFGEQIKGIVEALTNLSRDPEKMNLIVQISWGAALGAIAIGGIALAGSGIAFVLSVLGEAFKVDALKGLSSPKVIGGALQFFLPAIVIISLEYVLGKISGKTPEQMRENTMKSLPFMGQNQLMQNIMNSPKLVQDPLGTLAGKYNASPPAFSGDWWKAENQKLTDVKITIENLFTNSDKEDLDQSFLDNFVLPLVDLQGAGLK